MDADALNEIARAMQDWRQGDVVLGPITFTHVADLSRPLSQAAIDAAREAEVDGDELEIEPIDTTERGFVILTQTCDIIRDAQQRMFVEVAPLVHVTDVVLGEVRKLKRPNFAYVPNTAHLNLVGDLDRVMTVEKSIVSSWARTVGCNSSVEQADFARALARKRARHAFPDAFAPVFRALRDHTRAQLRRDTPEGQHFDKVIDIRAIAEPDWETPGAELTYYFVVEDGALSDETLNWPDHVERWGNMLVPDGWVLGASVAVDMITLNAKTYVESAQVDTDDYSPDA